MKCKGRYAESASSCNESNEPGTNIPPAGKRAIFKKDLGDNNDTVATFQLGKLIMSLNKRKYLIGAGKRKIEILKKV
jgi:hypothetical protein